jgi:hypothetical protein
MPIILPPSDSQDALVNGIAQALAGDGTLLLEGGTHFTRPGVNKHIAVGAGGLRIGPAGPSPLPAPSAGTPAVTPAVIRRPDHALSASAPDFNFGLFFIPTGPTSDEIAQATWKPFTDVASHTTFEFAVVMRGSIQISRLLIDCNMQNQGAESLPAHAAEHSAMLGFGGFRYSVPDAGTPRFMYVGFDSVAVDHVGFINGGFADDFWVAYVSSAHQPSLDHERLVGPALESASRNLVVLRARAAHHHSGRERSESRRGAGSQLEGRSTPRRTVQQIDLVNCSGSSPTR